MPRQLRRHPLAWVIALLPLAIGFAACERARQLTAPDAGNSADDERYRQAIAAAAARPRSLEPDGGPDATLVPTAPLATVLTGPTELIINGSFEFGSFAGWGVSTIGSGSPLNPWGVGTTSQAGWFTPLTPQDGRFDAWNGFDGGGPLQFVLLQNVSIPSNVIATLSWKDKLQWDYFDGLTATQPRKYSARLRDPTNGTVLANLYELSTGTGADSVKGSTGWQSHTANVSRFAGRNVQLVFEEIIPQNFTGPGQFELDAVSMIARPNEAPGVDPGGPYTTFPGTPVELTATGVDADGDAITYTWDLDGSGQFATAGPTVSFTPSGAVGSATSVCARASDGYGSATACTTVTIVSANSAPTAVPGSNDGGSPGSYVGTEGVAVAFDGSASSDPDGDALTYDWLFDDGTAGTGAKPTHAYADNGSYTATLRVSDGNGGVDVKTVVVTIANAAPTVDPGSNQTITGGTTATLSARFTDAGANDGKWPTSVDWGDGSTPTTELAVSQGPIRGTHAYAAPGVYTVTVSVRDKDGGVGRETLTITVSNRAPTADAGGNNQARNAYVGVEGQPVTFDGTGADADNDALTYAWDFLDGGTKPATASTTHTYGDDASTSAKFTVTDANGAATSVSVPVTIANVNPSATFSAPTSTVQEGGSVTLALSDPVDVAADLPGLKYAFDCGTGTLGAFLATQSITCTVPDDGSLTVKGQVKDKDGGVSEYRATITATNVAPTGTFSAPAAVVVGTPISLGFTTVTDPSTADVAAGIAQSFDCGAGAGFQAAKSCATSAVGTRQVSGRLTDKDGGSTTYGPTTVNVTRAPTAIAVDNAAGQYSDAVSLTATLSTTAPGAGSPSGSIEFFIAGTSVGTVAAFGTGVATLSNVVINRPAGSYAITATYTPDPAAANFAGSTTLTAGNLTVTREAVGTTYTGDSFLLTAGPTITSAPVRLAAQLTQQADALAGNLALARVRFDLCKGTNTTCATADQSIEAPADAAGNVLTTVSLGADNWTVKVFIASSNGYWSASPVGTSTFTVAIGDGSQRTTGGGWVADAKSTNGKGNFGFTVNYSKNSAPKGNAIYIFRGLDGYDYVVKSNSWQQGGLSFTTDPSKGSFTSKANVSKIDAATGLVVASLGNFTMTVDLVDGDVLNPKQSDRYAVTILDPSSAVWRQIGSRTSPPAIGGGNVSVQSR